MWVYELRTTFSFIVAAFFLFNRSLAFLFRLFLPSSDRTRFRVEGDGSGVTPSYYTSAVFIRVIALSQVDEDVLMVDRVTSLHKNVQIRVT